VHGDLCDGRLLQFTLRRRIRAILQDAKRAAMVHGRYRAVCRTNTAWGEHEVDYILFARKKVVLDGSTGTGLRVEPNANEVAAVKACTREDIYKLLQHQADTLTPWFRMIARTLLPEWWQNLGAALAQQRPYFDPIRIHDLGTS
jgi:isopentenyldiphosphate isomerase